MLKGRWLAGIHTKPSAKDNFGNKDVQESQVSVLWTSGLAWIKNRKGGDILHDHDSKACQMIICRLCRQQRRYQGRGTKRTIFLLVKTRRTNRQSSRPPVVTGMSTTIVTGLYLTRVVHRGVYISRELLLLRSYEFQERLNRPMERKM